MKIKRILIPTDFSKVADLAVAHGAYMAQLFGAKLFLLHSVEAEVYRMLPESVLFMEPGIIMEESSSSEHIVERLNRVAYQITKRYDVEPAVLTVSGKPSKGIASAVIDNDIDIIIMGTHGASGFEEFFVGSTTHKVVNLAPCPVISAQVFAKKPGFANIVMPIDNTLYSRQKVNDVITLANAYGSTVHILGLLNKEDTVLDEKKFAIKLDSVEAVVRQAGIPFVRKVVKGQNLAAEAMKYSEEKEADLIVIMSDHESNLTGMFMGAYAQQIVNHSKIPVLSIKPIESKMDFDPSGGTGVII